MLYSTCSHQNTEVRQYQLRPVQDPVYHRDIFPPVISHRNFRLTWSTFKIKCQEHTMLYPTGSLQNTKVRQYESWPVQDHVYYKNILLPVISNKKCRLIWDKNSAFKQGENFYTKVLVEICPCGNSSLTSTLENDLLETETINCCWLRVDATHLHVNWVMWSINRSAVGRWERCT